MRIHTCYSRRILVFFVALYLIQFNKLTAQATYQLPPNQPEQDACNALPICGGIFYTPYTYTGTGHVLDLDKTPCSNQPGGGEKNSVWLKLHVASAGNIVFKITPVDPQDDYNFAVVNITGISCSQLTSANVVRCNYNNNIPGSNPGGVIGLSDTSRIPYVMNGTFGESFNQPVFANTDDEYLIMINNLGNYVSGAPGKGFTIDFTGSTSFYNVPAPQLSNVDVPCNNATSIVVKTTTNILCSSIAPDGSDFITSPSAKIIGASGINCTAAGGYTNTMVINFSSALPPGDYILSPKKGSDNNMLTGFCNNELVSNGVPFKVRINSKAAVDNESTCFQQLPYTWNGMKINTGGDSVATYTTKSADGCDSTAILNLNVLQAPAQVSLSQTICDGDFYTLPWDSTVTTAGTYVHHFTNVNGCDSIVESITINVFTPAGGNTQARDSTIQTGFCVNGSVLLRPQDTFVSYQWNNGDTTSSLMVNIAGAYSLIAIDKFGCATIDTFVVARYQYPVTEFKSIENLCVGNTITLDAGISTTYYLWNDGSNTETLTTNKPGKFWVTLTTTHNCTATDTVNVVAVPSPSDFLISSVSKCPFNQVTITPLNNFSTYTWSNGSNEKSIEVSASGIYRLNVTDFNGCAGNDSIIVIDSLCPEYFYLPTAFTPNYDHLNDIFKPTFKGSISGYHLSIYDQWGKLIFSTKDPLSGWDGTISGYFQPLGVYVWTCSYSLDGHPLHNERGTVTLIR